MYIRCKRAKQTIFLSVDMNETILNIKKKISSIIKIPIEDIRILLNESTILEDNQTLNYYKIENDSIVFWVQKLNGNNNNYNKKNKENFIYIGLDEWETINIQKIEYKQQEVNNKLEQ